MIPLNFAIESLNKEYGYEVGLRSEEKYNGLEHGLVYATINPSNAAKNLDIEKNIFLTLNPHFNIDEKLVIDKIQFSHPYYDHDTLKNQKKLDLLQNKQNILFCGSYHGYGFHEDGIKSTLNMLKFIND